MSKLYITHELAIVLKETSFDEPCIVCYEELNEEGVFELSNFVNSTGIVSGVKTSLSTANQFCAPTYQQVIDWLRDNYSILITTQRSNHNFVMEVSNYSSVFDDFPFNRYVSYRAVGVDYYETLIEILSVLLENVKIKTK